MHNENQSYYYALDRVYQPNSSQVNIKKKLFRIYYIYCYSNLF